MHFLPDVYVTCDVCKGKRYNRETLEVLFRGKSIADVLDMTVEEGVEFFKAVPPIRDKLVTLQRSASATSTLGQQATTLSGGEAQRVKLAKELSRRATGRTLYILDEPTTGLHFEDVRKLLEVLHALVDAGNTVVVIEHNLEVIKTADWIIVSTATRVHTFTTGAVAHSRLGGCLPVQAAIAATRRRLFSTGVPSPQTRGRQHPIDRATRWRRPFGRGRGGRRLHRARSARGTGCAACHQEQHGLRGGCRLKIAAGLIERRAGLEGDAQGMLRGRTAAGEEGRERVQRVVEPQQPARRRAPAHRRLVDRGREAAGRDGGQDAGEARPGDVQEIAGRAALVDDLDQPAQAGNGQSRVRRRTGPSGPSSASAVQPKA